MSDPNETDTQPAAPSTPSEDSPQSSELFDKARSFLSSPKIYNSDDVSKRDFLKKKGLTESQIDALIAERREVGLQFNSFPGGKSQRYHFKLPPIPPRSYPQPPPSR